RFHHLARGALEACLRALAALGRERRVRCHLLFLRSGRHEILLATDLRSTSASGIVCQGKCARGPKVPAAPRSRPSPAYRAGASIAGAQLRPPCARQSSSRRCSNMALASQIPPPTTTMRKNSKSAFAIRRSRAVSTYLSPVGASGSSLASSWGAGAGGGMAVSRLPRAALERRRNQDTKRGGSPPAMVSFTTLTSCLSVNGLARKLNCLRSDRFLSKASSA